MQAGEEYEGAKKTAREANDRFAKLRRERHVRFFFLPCIRVWPLSHCMHARVWIGWFGRGYPPHPLTAP